MRTVRIRLHGRVSAQAATALGGWLESDGRDGSGRDDGVLLVAPYLDQAQLTGLFVQLAGLNLAFDRVVVEPAVGASPNIATHEPHHQEGAI